MEEYIALEVNRLGAIATLVQRQGSYALKRLSVLKSFVALCYLFLYLYFFFSQPQRGVIY
jgi:hypothetical protein